MDTSLKCANLFSVGLLGVVIGCIALARPATVSAEATQPPVVTQQDGKHDFDFNIGLWKTHIKRVLDPFSDATKFIELNGTVTARKV
jgi:hypothetical protein